MGITTLRAVTVYFDHQCVPTIKSLPSAEQVSINIWCINEIVGIIIIIITIIAFYWASTVWEVFC